MGRKTKQDHQPGIDRPDQPEEHSADERFSGIPAEYRQGGFHR